MKNDPESVTQSEEVLQTVVGARLTSVDFVLNYLILGFDNKGALTTLVWPIIVRNGHQLVFGATGYRDRLCELIAETVSRVEITGDETISFTFEQDVQLRIPLRSYTSTGERAIFTNPQHQLCVW